MFRFFVFVIFAFYLLQLESVLAQEPLKLVNDRWPPYTGENLPNKGLATDIVETALHRAGYKTTVDLLPWKRALIGTIEGTYDVLITTSYNEERAKKVTYSEPYLPNVVRIIRRKGSSYKFNSLEDLRGLNVGVVRGYLYEPDFDKATFFTKSPVDGFSKNLKKLNTKRVDLIVEDELNVLYAMKHDLLPDGLVLEFLSPPLNVKQLYIVIRKTRKDHKVIIKAFNKALADMREDGSYEDIIKRHGFRHFYKNKK